MESVSFYYILLSIISQAIWTSYAFKIQNIDLAVISIFPLVIAIILACIYLSVKPESRLIKLFFFTLLAALFFNLDLFSISICGLLGTISSVICNMVPLSFMPEVIKTRDVSGINMPLTYVNLANLGTWLLYALIKGDPFMTVS